VVWLAVVPRTQGFASGRIISIQGKVVPAQTEQLKASNNSHSQTQIWQLKRLELPVFCSAGPPEITGSVARLLFVAEWHCFICFLAASVLRPLY